ncbi:hypothetical protein ACFFWC_24605 [Plantactinospora siamensis]|uniref:Uncharacterized protein n=1 Tax=Plantactinospora siamensis TaxID=555372 RepID=A0ABV6P6P3_9ACTN
MTAAEHPVWCDPRECAELPSGGRAHTSAAVEVGPTVRVRLIQDGPAPAVTVEQDHPTGEPAEADRRPDELLILEPATAVALAVVLASMGRRAGASNGGAR